MGRHSTFSCGGDNHGIDFQLYDGAYGSDLLVSACSTEAIRPRSRRTRGHRIFRQAARLHRSDTSDTVDPFGAQADTAESLTNVSFHLEDVLENGALKDACAVWERDPTNRRKKLLCGKSMFFYEGFDGIGVPQTVFDFFPNKMPEIVGEAYSAYGLVPDPFSEEGRPLGFLPVGSSAGSRRSRMDAPRVTSGRCPMVVMR